MICLKTPEFGSGGGVRPLGLMALGTFASRVISSDPGPRSLRRSLLEVVLGQLDPIV